MKRIIAASAAVIIFAAFLPFISAWVPSGAAEEPEPTAKADFLPQRDEKVSVKLLDGGKTAELTMRDYLIGVVAAEMPVKFQPEALKAQAVAARTYAMRSMLAGTKHAAEGADVCSDPACCQAWLSGDELKKNWGGDYEADIKKITDAVVSTDGQYLISGGEPILAAFHSSSGGYTDSSAEVWGAEEPYLVSVSSPESDKNVPNFVTTMTAGRLDFRDTLLSAHPEADFTGKPETWIGDADRDGSGRVRTVKLGGVAVTGEELRSLFGLRSTNFTLSYGDGAFTFTVTGSGHGVGMSQYGAQTMALAGSGYADILTHYYPGAVLTGLQN